MSRLIEPLFRERNARLFISLPSDARSVVEPYGPTQGAARRVFQISVAPALGRPVRVLGRPREGVVRDFLPAVLAREVTAARVFLVLGGGRSLVLLLPVGPIDRRRADAVLLAGEEQQRRPLRTPVVDRRHRVRVEVGVAGLEERARRARNVIALVDRIRRFSGERVGEAPVELLLRERRRLVPAERVAKSRP